MIVQQLLAELGAVGYPKTSGGKGLHIYVRIAPEHGHPDVRRAAWAFAREVERRSDGLVDLTWWRKDRRPGSVFVDYNQNARDHTIASAYSVRGTPEGLVSAPVRWDEVADADPRDFTIATMPARFAELGDLHADIDDHPTGWTNCWSGPTATSATAPRRLPTTSDHLRYPGAARRGFAVGCCSGSGGWGRTSRATKAAMMYAPTTIGKVSQPMSVTTQTIKATRPRAEAITLTIEPR